MEDLAQHILMDAATNANETSTVWVIIVIIYFVAREGIPFIIWLRRRQSDTDASHILEVELDQETRDLLFGLNERVNDLHDWHKPNADGKQRWKVDEEAIHRHLRSIGEQISKEK